MKIYPRFPALVHIAQQFKRRFYRSHNGIRFRDLRIISGRLCRDKSTYSHYHCGQRPTFPFAGHCEQKAGLSRGVDRRRIHSVWLHKDSQDTQDFGAHVRNYFHLHLVSDSTGETLITVARAVAAQYANVTAVEHVYPLCAAKSSSIAWSTRSRRHPALCCSRCSRRIWLPG